MIGSAVLGFCKHATKHKQVLGGLLRLAMNGASMAVPGAGWAVGLVGELIGHGPSRLTDPTIAIPGVKNLGEIIGDEELEQIDGWMSRVSESMKGVVERVEKMIESVDKETMDKVTAKIKKLLTEKKELGEEFDKCLKEVRQHTLSLSRIEEKLDEHFHVQKGIAAGMEDIKSMLADGPSMRDWEEFRRVRPDALEAVSEADEHFLAGRREDGLRLLLGLVQQRGVGQQTLARHVGLLCAAEGRIDDARKHLTSAGQASPSASITRSLMQLSTLSTKTNGLKVWRTLPRGFVVDRRYRIESEVGRGGMASVYRAVGVDRVNRGKVVALKVPAPGLMDNEETSQRFVQEIEVSQKLSSGNHPHIVPTHNYVLFEDPFTRKELYALVMEFVEGCSLMYYLSERASRKKPLKPNEILHFLKPVCEALDFAHQQRPTVLHRDVKPHNVMVGRDGAIRLMDFGIARILDSAQDSLTRSGQAVGTPAYMPPEILSPGSPIDERTDVYLAGNLLLELMTFSPTGNAEDRDDCPAAWIDLIADSMNRVRSKRPATIREFLDRLTPRKVDVVAEPEPAYAEPIHVQPAAPKVATPKSTIVVATDGSGDFTSIQKAIKNSTSDARIFVRPGTYRESVYLEGERSLLGDGPRKQIIIEHQSESSLTLADHASAKGLTLRQVKAPGYSPSAKPCVAFDRGDLLLEDCDLSSINSTALSIAVDGARGTVRNCVIHDSATFGTLCSGRTSCRFERCEFARCALTAVVCDTGSRINLRDCRIHQGQAGGLLVSDPDSLATLEVCEIDHNNSNNIEIKKQAKIDLLTCKIHSSGFTGIWFSDRAGGKIKDCDIHSNKGSGFEVENRSDPDIRMCSVHDNVQDGFLFHTEARGVVDRCDITDNKLNGVEIKTLANPLISKCKIVHNGSPVYVHSNGKGRVADCDLPQGATVEAAKPESQGGGCALLIVLVLVFLGVGLYNNWWGALDEKKKRPYSPTTTQQYVDPYSKTPKSEEKKSDGNHLDGKRYDDERKFYDEKKPEAPKVAPIPPDELKTDGDFNRKLPDPGLDSPK
ncbi:MAG: protein kinase [Planctomycetes bacterium]|nr:protein kinase [Planctomycetota bacterium]